MYDNFSDDYDHFVNWKNRLAMEIPFIAEQIQKAVQKSVSEIRVLDAATGTGMHAVALQKMGYITYGVDISEAMIEKARQNARQENAYVHFTSAGFGNITANFQDNTKHGSPDSANQNVPFDVVLCLGNSLPHVNNQRELLIALLDFANIMNHNGLLIIQNRNFDAVMGVKERWMEPQSYRNATGEWVFLRFYDFLSDGMIQFNVVTLKREMEGEWRQSILETRLFPITRNILRKSLEEAGFIQISDYGALSDIPFFDETSGNLVITARKK